MTGFEKEDVTKEVEPQAQVENEKTSLAQNSSSAGIALGKFNFVINLLY